MPYRDPACWRMALDNLPSIVGGVLAGLLHHGAGRAEALSAPPAGRGGDRGAFVMAGSSGTRAALVYVRTYSAHVRGAFLSGAAPFENRAPLYHPEAAQRALDRLIAQCAAEPACAARFPETSTR